MEELKPCPFCPSGKGVAFKDNYDKYGVYCNSCNSQTGLYSTIDDAVTAWNTRPDSWISVDERLPETNEDVLVVVDYGGKSGVITGYMRSQNLGWQGLVGQRLTDVTHWQPLPEPPKGVE